MQKLPVWPAVIADLVCVLAFTLVGTASHASAGSAGHVVAVAAPFVIGLAVGWLATRGWRAPAQPWPTGVAIWFATAALGLLLRPLFTGGFAWSFSLVTAVFLALTMIGWRLLAALAQRRRQTS
ncbi:MULTISPECIES: DUF3054 domain-containing protein [Isoptericola]|uniref:DUF3054 domain-containing protein n=1 Tax=Isoptericola TaxID=254250 RepID=UPI0027127218|nr:MULTISPECIES: DUF3054 domain-containing protein [unclassified Isoptericola]MDO8144417.1 DUF3054 domain-containing protein [Isoptericola sp. 178]MDO8148271.1 DUF3054 domain-containing protein [Isoptericola sp. b515]